MGLFGDRDVKNLEAEVMAMKMALEMRDRADPAQLARGIESGIVDISNLVGALDRKGKGDQARQIVRTTTPKTFSPEAQTMWAGILPRIEARIG